MRGAHILCARHPGSVQLPLGAVRDQGLTCLVIGRRAAKRQGDRDLLFRRARIPGTTPTVDTVKLRNDRPTRSPAGAALDGRVVVPEWLGPFPYKHGRCAALHRLHAVKNCPRISPRSGCAFQPALSGSAEAATGGAADLRREADRDAIGVGQIDALDRLPSADVRDT